MADDGVFVLAGGKAQSVWMDKQNKGVQWNIPTNNNDNNNNKTLCELCVSLDTDAFLFIHFSAQVPLFCIQRDACHDF